MNKYTVTYDHNVYRPQSLSIFDRQRAYKETVEADNLEDAKALFKSKFNKNPFYFKFTLN